MAYYTTTPETSEISAGAWREHLRARLPEYMVPAAYVRLDSWPLTANGKLDRAALPAPDGGAFAVREYEPPVGRMETVLAGIWEEVLPAPRVGRHDDFFALGGHSLSAVRMVTRVRQLLGAEVAIGELFERPVLVDFAGALAEAARSSLPPLVAQPRAERIPLSFAQQRLWVLAQMGVRAPYHVPWTIQLTGMLDRGALQRALDLLVARHETLRTTFTDVDGEPAQEIAPAAISRFDLHDEDLRHQHDAQVALVRLLTEHTQKPFDLGGGPAIRGLLIRLRDDVHVLTITLHHIVSDGWSMNVLRHELRVLYDACLRGTDDPLPALPIQYADYAIWQRAWLDGNRLAGHVDYWRTTLAGAPELLTLPADRPRPARQDSSGAFAPIVLDAALTAQLTALARRHGTTLYMTVLAAWAALLVRLSGQDEVVLGTPVANRGDVAVEGLIGFFVNTLAVRVNASDAPTVAEWLAHVKAQVLAAQAHQELPFEQVVELVKPVRSVAQHPVFQATFTWQRVSDETPFELTGLAVGAVPWAASRQAKFDVTLALQEVGGRIAGGVEYATALFDEATIEGWLHSLKELLHRMAADDGLVVERLPLLPARESAALVAQGRRAAVAVDAPDVVSAIAAQVAARPDAIAVVDGADVVSYGALDGRARALAAVLRTHGVGPDVRVGAVRGAQRRADRGGTGGVAGGWRLCGAGPGLARRAAAGPDRGERRGGVADPDAAAGARGDRRGTAGDRPRRAGTRCDPARCDRAAGADPARAAGVCDLHVGLDRHAERGWRQP